MKVSLSVTYNEESKNMFFFFQAEDGIRDDLVTGVQTCALPIYRRRTHARTRSGTAARAVAGVAGNDDGSRQVAQLSAPLLDDRRARPCGRADLILFGLRAGLPDQLAEPHDVAPDHPGKLFWRARNHDRA